MIAFPEPVPPTLAAKVGNVSAKFMREEITMAAHDLRNPLACVVSTLELLEAKAKKTGMNNEVSHVVRRGLRAADRMDGMIQRLLENARRQADALNTDKTMCSLRSVVEAAIEHNMLNAQSKGISIKLCGPDILADTDDDLLVEAVDNLVSNAVKYSHFGSKIHCKIGQDARSAFIRITDHGRGLTRNDLKRLGQPFQRYCQND